jgi:uncharacterized protein YggE
MQKINMTAIIVAALVVIAVLVGVSMLLNNGEKQTISTTGNAQIKVDPDEAVVYLLVDTRAVTAEAAKDKNAVISDKVLTELIKLGIDRKDIQTENYNIYPEYNWSSGYQDLIGYVASNTFKVGTTDFGKVGTIIDASVNAGALVNYINFELSNAKSNEYKTKALADASKDATSKADAIAAGLGMKVGKLVSVSASDYNYMPYPIYRMGSAGAESVKDVATNIQPQQLEVAASVTAVFALN